MLEAVIKWIVEILFIICALISTIINIAHLSFKWKCRKKHYNEYLNPCHESDCKWSKFCENYEYTFSAKEISGLYKMIEDYQNDQKRDMKSL